MAAPHCLKLLFFLLLIYSLHVISISFTIDSTKSCHDHERSALLHFKQSLFASSESSAYMKTGSWEVRGNSSSDCCSWEGVECDEATGYVIGLDLSSSLIQATLHSNSTLFSLVHLQTLNLSDNNFMNSSIPPEISRLSSLSSLNLSFSSFSGSIPASIGNLSQLTFLSVASNMFTNSGNLWWLHKLNKLSVLNLKSTNLYGDFPPSLANLTQLTEIQVPHNYFVGEIPLWLMNMTQLSRLDLKFNELTGQIPRSFSQLYNLKYLSLSSNNFAGTVEADIFRSLRNLTLLNLSNCKITLLDTHHSNFTLPKLQVLILSSCNLTEFPYFLQFQSNLRMLELDGNSIHGHIPHWIWIASKNLELLSLRDNYLTAIEQNPIAIQSKSLRFIDISNNMLQGNLPVPPPNTILYSAFKNRFTGYISPLICGVMFLKVLDLSNNSMSGPIPQCLALVDSLTALLLQDNNFSGTIPQRYPKECELAVMDLSQNQLTGEVPKSLSNCKMLQILDLSNNQLNQTFPSWLGTLVRLQVLQLDSNKFHGEIGTPRNPGEFPMLCIINLSHNSLTGALPVDHIQIWNAMKIFRAGMEPYIKTSMNFTGFTSNGITAHSTYNVEYHNSIILTNKGVETKYEKISNIFTAIDLSSNKFTGQIPESLGSLVALQLLDFSNNDLTGPIPPSLGNLTQLESLDLSRNKLSGVIPPYLAAQLNFLAFFNVSDNFLGGHIPQGSQFKTFSNNSYIGNYGLCGFPLSKNCETVQSPPDENDDSDEDKFPSGFDWLFIFLGLGSGLVVGSVIGNILTDTRPWLIDGIIQTFKGTRKNRRRRPIIWN